MCQWLTNCLYFPLSSACSAPPKAPTTEDGTARQATGEVGKLYAANPPHISEMDARLQDKLPLAGAPRRNQPPLHQTLDAQSAGYALRERIRDRQTRAGTFLDQREELTARWWKKVDSGPMRQEPCFFKLVGRKRRAASKMHKHL